MPDALKKSARQRQKIMTILEKSKKATEFYDSYKAKTLWTGFEKFVATDGNDCMFVNSDYDPENDEICVFKLDTRNGKTGCQLYKPRKQ